MSNKTFSALALKIKTTYISKNNFEDGYRYIDKNNNEYKWCDAGYCEILTINNHCYVRTHLIDGPIIEEKF